jgi:hypothetical protein
MMTKADLDAFRRDLERRILAGEYQPDCEPGQWWDLWRRLEDDLLKPEQQ